MANLGCIGLGAMGGRIADRLLSKGHTVIGLNRTKSKAQWLLDKGLNAVAEGCSFIYWPSFQEFPHDHRHEDGD